MRRARYERSHDVYRIYEEDWDLLVVLDACRYDLLPEVRDEYGFISNEPQRYSPASSSREWLEASFDSHYGEMIAETAYVTGNPFTKEVLDESKFAMLDEVWQYAWDTSKGTVSPRPLTDRTIRVCRSHSPRRCIVHYMQPHFPALSNPELGGKIDRKRNVWINPVWEQLEEDELDRSTVWEAYRQNLREALDEVAHLLENVDAKRVIITADHGNRFNENDIYGHPADAVYDVVREVP